MKRLAGLFVVLFSALTWAQQKEDPCALKPPKGSDVALVEYEDLQCPDCARAAPLLKKSQMLRRIMQDVGKASGAAEDAVWVYLCDIPAANVAEYGRVCITGATPAGHNLEAKVVSESAEIVVPVGYCGELDARQVTVVPAAAVGRTQQIHGYHEIVG